LQLQDDNHCNNPYNEVLLYSSGKKRELSGRINMHVGAEQDKETAASQLLHTFSHSRCHRWGVGRSLGPVGEGSLAANTSLSRNRQASSLLQARVRKQLFCGFQTTPRHTAPEGGSQGCRMCIGDYEPFCCGGHEEIKCVPKVYCGEPSLTHPCNTYCWRK